MNLVNPQSYRSVEFRLLCLVTSVTLISGDRTVVIGKKGELLKKKKRHKRLSENKKIFSYIFKSKLNNVERKFRDLFTLH